MTFLPEWSNANAIGNTGQMTGVMAVPGGSHHVYPDLGGRGDPENRHTG
jgi:hypothetical protein